MKKTLIHALGIAGMLAVVFSPFLMLDAQQAATNQGAVRADGQAGAGSSNVPNTRTIATTAPLSGGGDLSANRTLTTSMSTNKLIGRGTSGTGVMEEITLGTNLSFTGTTLNATGGGSADAIVGVAGAGGARITTLQYSPDVVPGGGSDDEFDVTDTSDPMTGWTTIGTPTTHDINSTAKSHYYVKKNSASTSVTGIYKAWTPSNGQVLIAKVMTAKYVGSTFMRCGGLFISTSTPGKVISISGTGDGGGKIYVDVWTNPTTFGSTAGQVTGFPNVLGWQSQPLWFKITYNSSTSIDYAVSTNGLQWVTVLAANNPGMTVGSFGLMVEPESNNVEAYFDYVRLQ